MKTNLNEADNNTLIVMSAKDLKDAIEYLVEKKISAKVEEPKKDQPLTREQVVNLLGVSLPTLWRWARDKTLVPVHLGGRVFYNKADIDVILNKKEDKK